VVSDRTPLIEKADTSSVFQSVNSRQGVGQKTDAEDASSAPTAAASIKITPFASSAPATAGSPATPSGPHKAAPTATSR
jgi:hypothetical protein